MMKSHKKFGLKAISFAVLLGAGTLVAAADAAMTEEQKLAYSFGATLGKKMKADMPSMDVKMFSQALEDVFSGAKLKVTDQEIAASLQGYQKKMQQERVARFNKLAEDNKKKGEKFLAENKAKDGVKTTASGLQYKVLTAGTGKKPTAEDSVQVHYEGRLTDGKVFDSSISRGQPVTFPLNGVIQGWTQGLQLMKEGAKWQLYIPANLAYGPGGNRNIGPNEVLVFDVELLKVNPKDKK